MLGSVHNLFTNKKMDIIAKIIRNLTNQVFRFYQKIYCSVRLLYDIALVCATFIVLDFGERYITRLFCNYKANLGTKFLWLV